MVKINTFTNSIEKVGMKESVLWIMGFWQRRLIIMLIIIITPLGVSPYNHEPQHLHYLDLIAVLTG